MIETLEQLGVLDDASRYPTLRERRRPPVTNARKLVVGEVYADFKLRRC